MVLAYWATKRPSRAIILVMFGTLYIFTLIGLLLNIVSDISYTLVDPRIDFEGR